jgi:hypothetical protein
MFHDRLRAFGPAVLTIVILAHAAPAAAQSSRETGTVLESAPIYLAPDSTRTPLRTAATGTVLEVISSEGPWLQVKFQDPQFGPRIGYVEERLVRRPPAASLRPVDLSVQPSDASASSDSAPAAAQNALGGSESRTPAAGSTEIVALGSLSGVSANGNTTTELLMQVFGGVFANRHLEVGGTLTGYKLADFDMLGSVGGVGLLNFPNNSLVLPFIGGGVGKGFGYSALMGNPWYVDVQGGFRVLTPRGGGALVVRPFYQRQFYPETLAGGDMNLFGVAIGASVIF